MVADTNVAAKPANRGGISVKELSSLIKIFENCASVGYNDANTINLNISLICLRTPPSQLLRRVPANMDPIPTHKIGRRPETNCPNMTLLDTSEINSASGSILVVSTPAMPACNSRHFHRNEPGKVS